MKSKPTKCTRKTMARIKEALLLGATYKIAAQYAGIGMSTFYEWKKDKPEFLDAVESTEAACAMFHLKLLKKAAVKGDVTTSKYILDRRHGYIEKMQVDLNIGVMEKLDEEADRWREGRKK